MNFPACGKISSQQMAVKPLVCIKKTNQALCPGGIGKPEVCQPAKSSLLSVAVNRVLRDIRAHSSHIHQVAFVQQAADLSSCSETIQSAKSETSSIWPLMEKAGHPCLRSQRPLTVALRAAFLTASLFLVWNLNLK